MMDSPMKTLGFLVLYFVALAKIKDHMENRKPYELKLVLIVYNALQVFGSFYIFFEVKTFNISVIFNVEKSYLFFSISF
jgi:hypothetical protein